MNQEEFGFRVRQALKMTPFQPELPLSMSQEE